MQEIDDDIEIIDEAPQAPAAPTALVPGSRRATITTTAPAVGSTISAGTSNGKAYLAKPDVEWVWSDLRDYVIDMARKTHGQHLQRDPITEKAIFSSFLNRHGFKGVQIARYAFETSAHPGYWMQAPIRPSRFTKNADAAFADKIAAKLD